MDRILTVQLSGKVINQDSRHLLRTGGQNVLRRLAGRLCLRRDRCVEDGYGPKSKTKRYAESYDTEVPMTVLFLEHEDVNTIS